MGKTLPLAPPMTGNGGHIPPIYGDLGDGFVMPTGERPELCDCEAGNQKENCLRSPYWKGVTTCKGGQSC